jgi:hypothetical protein
MTMRRVLLIAAVTTLLSLISAGMAAAADGSYLYMRGDSGDYLVGANTHWYTSADALFAAQYGCDGCGASGPRGTTMMGSLHTANYEHWWNVWLSPLLGQPLVPGTYENAQRSDFRDATHPGLDVFGDGRGCNTVSGRFTVYTADFTGHTVNHFRATFEEHCEGFMPALRGEIGINVPIPPAPPTGKVLINNGAVATASTSASLSISGSRIAQFRVSTDGSLDSEPFQAYTPSIPITLPGGDGPKTVLAQFKNSVGFVSDASDSIILDTIAPTGAKFTNPSSCCTAVATVNPFRVAWTASDSGSGVASYAVSYTSARYDGGFGPSTSVFPHTTSNHMNFSGFPGKQYCFTMKATDKAGNVSAPAKGCFVLPIDDASLSDSTANWTRATAAPYYYLSTYSTSGADGATLVSPTLQAKRVGILYTKCPGCGTLEVSFNGVVLGTIDSHAASVTTTKQLAYFPRFDSVLQGTAQIRSVGGLPVYVDGLVFSRS